MSKRDVGLLLSDMQWMRAARNFEIIGEAANSD